MLDFIIVGLPRSGTTWAANWLTTDQVHCVHDPLYSVHYSDWDTVLPARAPCRTVGASCTGIWRFRDWLNDHPARMLVLERDLGEIVESMVSLGVEPVTENDAAILSSLRGRHVPFTDLFDLEKAKSIWHYLAPGVLFNEARHQELVNIEMQPKFDGLTVNHDVTRKLLRELAMAATGW